MEGMSFADQALHISVSFSSALGNQCFFKRRGMKGMSFADNALRISVPFSSALGNMCFF